MQAQHEGMVHAHASACDASPVLGDFGVPAPAIAIMLASDRRARHAAWLSWLAWEPGVEITGGPVTDAAGLADAVARHRPDVLLLDSTMLERLDAASLRRIQCCRHVRVLLVVEEAGHHAVGEVLRHRFQGLLPTTSPGFLCLKAIRAVHAGELWLSRRLMAEVLADAEWPRVRLESRASDDPDHAPASKSLTHRERQVVACLNQGCSNKEIARELGIVEDTVKKHLKSVYAKLGVRRRAMVMLQATA